jgi:hypothetical protein
MIGGLVRKFAKSDESDDWSLEQELKPEVKGSPEFPVTGSMSPASPWSTASFSPSESNPADYYKGIVKAAIENGGRYAGHYIPTPWLRMILAGLEFRRVEPETLWQGAEGSSPGDAHLSDVSSYYALFPYERELPAGPR